MRVAFVTPELNSLVRRTSLAEVAESLPRTLRQEGADVRVFLPYSADVDARPLSTLQIVGEVKVKDGAGKIPLTIHHAQLGDLPIYLIEHPQLFRSRHVYGDDSGPYSDNGRRYAIFARAMLESLKLVEFTPDVIHCMDWTSGLVPVIRELEYADGDHPAAHAGTFFGVHNLAMKSDFEREILPQIGIPHNLFKHVRGVELQGKVNYQKAGAEFATIVGVSSPSLAERLQTAKRGDGLEDTFRRRAKEVVGITYGIDYQHWDPSNDSRLPQTFSVKDKELAGKRKCKAALQTQLGLDTGARIMVAAVIGRFDADSGFDILAEVLTSVLERNVEVILMGAGKSDILDRIRTMEQTFAGRCRLVEGMNPDFTHPLLGGADILIQPTHYHASNKLCAIAMRYGVVPLVYSGGGLDDTVTDYQRDSRRGTGFLFKTHSGESLLEGLDAARAVYKEAADWRTLAMRCLKQDFSWKATAQAYIKAYRRVTRRTKSSAVDD